MTKRKSRAIASLDLAQLRAELIRDEGERLMPYVDTVGKTTIGVGRNLTDRGITKEESQFLLTNDITATVIALRQALPWVMRLDAVRQRVLINLGFNIGVAGLLKFKNTLAAVQRGDYDRAAQGMLASQWARQVGARALRLAKMMRDGEMPADKGELKA